MSKTVRPNNLISGSAWSVFGGIMNMIVVLFTNIIISRFLTPNEIGQFGLASFFIFLANVFVDAGISGALIRKDNLTNDDYSTVFIFNLIVSVVLYLILILSANSISIFFNYEELESVIIFSGISIIINAFQITYRVKLVKEFRFKVTAIYSIISITLGSTIGIFLAYTGYGVWSVVAISLLNSAFFLLFLILFEDRIIKRLVFSKRVFHEVFQFGIYTTFVSIITIIFENIYQIVLGKLFNLSIVGYYFQSRRLTDAQYTLTMSTLNGPIYAFLSGFKDKDELFANHFVRIFYFLLGLLGFSVLVFFQFSDQIVKLLFGDAWSESGFFLRFLSISSFFFSLEIIFNVLFKIFNKTKNFMFLEMVKKGFTIFTLLFSFVYTNILVLIAGLILSSLFSFSLTFYYGNKFLNFNLSKLTFPLLKFIGIIISVIFIVSMLQIGNFYINLVISFILYVFMLNFFKIIIITDLIKTKVSV